MLTPSGRPRKPPRNDLPAPLVQEFRQKLGVALSARDQDNRIIAHAKWGVYAFYDYDAEPIYVGQTNEQLRARVQRHLTNQRTDAVAMRILDVFEVAELEMWPLWDLEPVRPGADAAAGGAAQHQLDAIEYNAYLRAVERSRFRAILNEKIPPVSPPTDLPASFRFELISPHARAERGHPDIRIARRAETISRLAAVAHERGEVSAGLRRVLVIQAVRLAHLAAVRLAYVEGRTAPDPAAIDVDTLVGSVLAEVEHGDSGGEHAGEAALEG